MFLHIIYLFVGGSVFLFLNVCVPFNKQASSISLSKDE